MHEYVEYRLQRHRTQYTQKGKKRKEGKKWHFSKSHGDIANREESL